MSCYRYQSLPEVLQDDRVALKSVKGKAVLHWDEHQQIITRLYKHDRKPLKVVMVYMARHYGFLAS